METANAIKTLYEFLVAHDADEETMAAFNQLRNRFAEFMGILMFNQSMNVATAPEED